MPPVRNIEDAPQARRHELLDLIFHLAENHPAGVVDDRVYHIICQHCGRMGSANPYGGFRRGASRVIDDVGWPRIYDLIVRLWPEFVQSGQVNEYREGVNHILAGNGVAWDLGEDCRLHRVLPEAAQAQVQAAIAELSDPRYAPALAVFNAARDAYDDRPRRDREACINVFQSVESTAQIRYEMPGRGLDDMLAALQRRRAFNAQLLDALDALNVLRHRNFGHGMAQDFNLSPAEVDFMYLTCIGAILLFTRTP